MSDDTERLYRTKIKEILPRDYGAWENSAIATNSQGIGQGLALNRSDIDALLENKVIVIEINGLEYSLVIYYEGSEP